MAVSSFIWWFLRRNVFLATERLLLTKPRKDNKWVKGSHQHCSSNHWEPCYVFSHKLYYGHWMQGQLILERNEPSCSDFIASLALLEMFDKIKHLLINDRWGDVKGRMCLWLVSSFDHWISLVSNVCLCFVFDGGSN